MTDLQLEKATELEINYKEYPEFMFAMIAAYLPEDEGIDLRRVAGDVIFRHTDNYGRTYKNGVLHSYDDMPACDIYGFKLWYRNGKYHRDGDEPAYIQKFGNESPVFHKRWYKNGQLHRDGDQPAVIRPNSNCKEWWKNGKLHRDGDLPAFIDQEKQEWYKDGKRHRERGLPAFIYCNKVEWWVDGQKIR